MLFDEIKKISGMMEIQDSSDPAKVCYPIGPTLFAIMLAWMCGYNSSVQVAMFWELKFDTLNCDAIAFRYLDIVSVVLKTILSMDYFSIYQEVSFGQMMSIKEFNN